MSDYLKFIGALYKSDYARRFKICMFCRTEFSDVTKRNLRKTCSDKCDIASMISKRKERNNYSQSEESKRKKSISVRNTYATKVVFSVELRAKFSETMKKNWATGKITSDNHWAKTQKGKQFLSNCFKGKKLGRQIKMSLAAQKRLRTKRETHYSSARGGFRSDLNCYFRSMWEANFARILTFQNKKWVYENDHFQLEESFSYTPDFYVESENTYYEIKGRFDEKSKRQLDLMKIKFPNVRIEIIDSAKYSELRVQYKNLLSNAWEGK